MLTEFQSDSPEKTFEIAAEIGRNLKGGEVILLEGQLGAGKTLFTKGLASALDFDPDEVTSPSFALVNKYRAVFEVFHIDLWRLDASGDPSFAVGLDEILENENAVVIVEWSERLNGFEFGRPVLSVEIKGNGDQPRQITIRESI